VAPPLALGVVFLLPLLILAFTALGGAGTVMAAKGHRRWKTWEIVLGMVLLIVLSPLMSPLFLLFLAIAALGRSIQMLAWGIMARKPVEQRKPYLAQAQPGRLLGAGAGLLATTALSCVIFSAQYRTMLIGLMEAKNLGNLRTIRSALDRYSKDMGGRYPDSLTTLTVSTKYLLSVRETRYLPHPDSNAVLLGKAADDAGGWLYNNDPEDPGFGTILVNCTHTDVKGTRWTAY
jgi:hypothetical protein